MWLQAALFKLRILVDSDAPTVSNAHGLACLNVVCLRYDVWFLQKCSNRF